MSSDGQSLSSSDGQSLTPIDGQSLSPSDAQSRRIARVLLDSPLPQLDRLFDYALPDELGDVVPGVRVRVPLRTAGRVIDGYVIELDSEDDADRPLSEVDSVVSQVPVLPDRLYRLARRAADRAAGSASDVLRLVIPKRQVRVEKAWRADSPQVVSTEEQLAGAAELVASYDGLEEVLESGGRAAVEAIPVHHDGAPGWAALLASSAARMLAAGQSSILVVPDHRDLDQLLAVLATSVPAEAVARYDSRQTNPDRYRSFLRSLEDAPCIVVGNRSAVYAPVRAGLVAVWDDGDPLLGEPLAPYINARDAALLRQEQEDSALLFVGHTRTTDAERLVAHGWLQDVRAARRVLPRVVLSTPQEMDAPTAQRMPSSAFLSARNAAAEGPVLVQVSRPGFSPSLVCAECRAPARCAHCGGPLGAKHRGAVPVCAWCGRGARVWACPACSSTKLRLASSGSERTADELGKAFPGIRVIVADSAHPVEHVTDKPSLVVATRGAEPLADGGYRAVERRACAGGPMRRPSRLPVPRSTSSESTAPSRGHSPRGTSPGTRGRSWRNAHRCTCPRRRAWRWSKVPPQRSAGHSRLCRNSRCRRMPCSDRCRSNPRTTRPVSAPSSASTTEPGPGSRRRSVPRSSPKP